MERKFRGIHSKARLLQVFTFGHIKAHESLSALPGMPSVTRDQRTVESIRVGVEIIPLIEPFSTIGGVIVLEVVR